MASTRRGFCAVSHVTALVPWTPSAAKVFKSAWMPAPPPLSEPAMVNATGMDLGLGMNQGATSGNRFVDDCSGGGIMSLMVCIGCSGKKKIRGMKTGSLFGLWMSPVILYSKVL